MAMRNPKGRANYEPNSWGDAGGPRESPKVGFQSYPSPVEGTQAAGPVGDVRRPLQPGPAVLHQPDRHRAAAHRRTRWSFELSKVETPAIRARMVSHLLNIDEGLADAVAKGLRLKEMPKPAAGRQADPAGPQAVAGAEHHQERPEELRRPEGRGARHRRGGCRGARWRSARR